MNSAFENSLGQVLSITDEGLDYLDKRSKTHISFPYGSFLSFSLNKSMFGDTAEIIGRPDGLRQYRETYSCMKGQREELSKLLPEIRKRMHEVEDCIPINLFNYDNRKREEEQDNKRKKHLEQEEKELGLKLIFDLKGVRGKSMRVYEDRVIISVQIGVGAFLTGNWSDGEKTIFYRDCIGVQFKESGGLIGYIQLETASGLMNNKKNNFFNENTFNFDLSTGTNEEMREVANYIKKRVAEVKNAEAKPVVAQISVADELKKFKELLDLDIITQEEFDAKKKQLLGL